jgi:ribosomal protein L1
MKPPTAKGQFIKKLALSGTMTPSVLVDTSTGSGLE